MIDRNRYKGDEVRNVDKKKKWERRRSGLNLGYVMNGLKYVKKK